MIDGWIELRARRAPPRRARVVRTMCTRTRTRTLLLALAMPLAIARSRTPAHGCGTLRMHRGAWPSRPAASTCSLRGHHRRPVCCRLCQLHRRPMPLMEALHRHTAVTTSQQTQRTCRRLPNAFLHSHCLLHHRQDRPTCSRLQSHLYLRRVRTTMPCRRRKKPGGRVASSSCPDPWTSSTTLASRCWSRRTATERLRAGASPVLPFGWHARRGHLLP